MADVVRLERPPARWCTVRAERGVVAGSGRVVSLLIVTLAAAAFAGCGPSAGNGSPGGTSAPRSGHQQVRIVATVGMVADIVRQVAGERAEVVSLLREGVDPHLYKPTRNDVRALLDADVVFYNGLMLEGRMAETLKSVGKRGKPVHAVTDGIARSRLRTLAGQEGHPDPHVWMDAALWTECVRYAAEKLAEFDPAGAADYRRNAEQYAGQLARLHEYGVSRIGSIPPPQRLLVTAHDAFGYFSKAYGIDVASPQGLSTESEASVDDVNRLVAVLVERQVGAIFVESSVSEKNLRAILEGAADRGWQVRIGGQLFSDAMGPAGTYEGTYLGMLDHNITIIAGELGGAAPERGMDGRLGL